MGKYLNIGNAGFETVRKGIYVDKTGLISFINSTLGTSDKMTCVSRPRRFGKSFAAKMHIDMNEDGLKEAIAQMLGGAWIKIDAGTFQNDMTTIKSRDDVLTLLVHLGYLAYDTTKKSVHIPNEEIREEFVRAVTTGKLKTMITHMR